jgi:peptide/nickel transport system ATP-binding protein
MSVVRAETAVQVRDLRVELSGHADVVDEITLEIHPGEVLGLVGESGSGKTTVGMALLGHVRRGGAVSGGVVLIDGQDVAGLGESGLRKLRGGTVAYIPQDPGTSLNPALRLRTQLSEVLEAHAGQWGGDERASRMREALEEVALPSDDTFLARYPHQLSGGQQQRVAIAMAFACRPNVIVCDEPTTGLDVTTQARVLQTVRELCRSHHVAALYVSHDLAVVAELADRVAVMYAGRIVESGTRDELFLAPRHPYTRRLLRAVPDLEGKRAVVGIPGHAPMPRNRPEGCTFHPRCPLQTEECRRAFPPATEVGPAHLVRCYHADEAAREIPVEGATSVARGHQEREVVLSIHGLDAHHGARHTLFGIELEVHRHECLALVGESGSGKTTLARCVAGLHKDFTGELRLRDAILPPAARSRSDAARKEIQYVFQNPYASLNPRRTVGQTIARQLELFGLGGKDVSGRVGECLERVALSGSAANHYPDELSGGERQRVAIARALAAEPSVMVCDEITSALDVSVQAAIIDLLRVLRTEMGLSLLFITHNLALIRTIADRVAVMTEGKIVETGPTVRLFEDPTAPYTRQLLANTPSIAAAQGPAAAPAG